MNIEELVEPEHGRVHASIYTDPEIFREEMRRLSENSRKIYEPSAVQIVAYFIILPAARGESLAEPATTALA